MIYVVQPGDTLYRISRRFGHPVGQIAALNQIPDPNVLMPGQALVLPGDEAPSRIRRAGYAYPFISPYVLEQTLSRIDLLCLFSYGFRPDGTLLPPVPDARWMAERSVARGVATALVLTPMDARGRFSNVLIHHLLNSAPSRQRLLEQLEQTMAALGCREVNLDFEYILPEDRDAFTAFVAQAAETLPQAVSVCLAPKTSRDQRGLLYEGKDYAAIGRAADRVLLMTYEWGYKYGPPMAVAPIGPVRRVVEYALTEIPREKITLGLPNYGYDWPLPYEKGKTAARTIGSIEAVELARRERTNIIFDVPSQSPWFSYRAEGVPHVVWFEDARSWQAKLSLIREYGLSGTGIWTVMNLNRPGLYLLGHDGG